MKLKYKVVLLTLLILSCREKKVRSIKINDSTIVYGDINKDTIFNGLIEYSDLRSGKIFRKCEFINGLENGNDTEYYDNGLISFKCNYSFGKINGPIYFFDSVGDIKSKQYYFYDLRVGNSTEYKNGRELFYKFYSLDGNPLLEFDYDSLKYKKLSKDQSFYFFFKINEYNEAQRGASSTLKRELFLYTPSPPKLGFQYSIVIIDSGYNVLSTIHTCDTLTPWSIVDIDNSVWGKHQLAVRLKIRDFNERSVSMFKRVSDNE